VRLPMFCYASWSAPNERFQSEHFGRVILQGEGLMKYCLWRGSLNNTQASEWEAFLGGTNPANDWTNRLAAFRFSDKGGKPEDSHTSTSLADMPRELIQKGLSQKEEISTRRGN